MIKTNVYDLHLKKTNSFYVGKPCINIAKSEVLFEIYIMALNWDKSDIEVRDYDAIKRNQTFFDIIQRKFNFLDELYMHDKFVS